MCVKDEWEFDVGFVLVLVLERAGWDGRRAATSEAGECLVDDDNNVR